MQRTIPSKALFAGLVLATFGGCSAGESPGGTAATGDGLRAINGTDLYVKEVGEGDPILVIHGGPGMEHSYLLPGLDLGSDARMVLYDQRGTGRSAEAPPGSVSLDVFLEDIDGVRESMGRDRVNVLAHSWGGLLGLLYAARYPDHVRSLVLVSSVEPGQRFAAQAAQRQGAARMPEDVALMDSLASSPAFAAQDAAAVSALYWAALRPTFADRSMADRLTIDFTQLTARRGSEVARELMMPLGDFDFWAEAASIAAPTLIVHGDADPTPLEMADALAATIPSAHLAVIDGAGHFPFLERPDEFRSAVTNFLGSLPGGQ